MLTSTHQTNEMRKQALTPPAWEVGDLRFWRVGYGTGITPEAAVRNHNLCVRGREISKKHEDLAIRRRLVREVMDEQKRARAGVLGALLCKARLEWKPPIVAKQKRRVKVIA